LAKGKSLPEAVADAKQFVATEIQNFKLRTHN
jgi:hydroxymethylpyrimidine/phosphomethylpyrimidine kinase